MGDPARPDRGSDPRHHAFPVWVLVVDPSLRGERSSRHPLLFPLPSRESIEVRTQLVRVLMPCVLSPRVNGVCSKPPRLRSSVAPGRSIARDTALRYRRSVPDYERTIPTPWKVQVANQGWRSSCPLLLSRTGVCSSTWKRAPRSDGSNLTSPPCLRARSRAMERPMPVPVTPSESLLLIR